MPRAGDSEAFPQLVEPHRHELHVHCYRVLGSLADAEDMLQDTLSAAWQGLPGFEERASLWSWLYRIATNRCLNWLRSVNRRRPGGERPLARRAAPAHPALRGHPAGAISRRIAAWLGQARTRTRGSFRDA